MFNRLSRLGNHNPPATAESKWTRPTHRLAEPVILLVASWRPSSGLQIDELHEFLTTESSHDPKQRELVKTMQLRTVSREISYLEYIRISTNHGIEVKVYQDGLTVASIETAELDSAESLLNSFLSTTWGPLIGVIWPDEVRHYGDKRPHKPMVLANLSLLEANDLLPAEFGHEISRQQDGQRTAILTDKFTVLMGNKGQADSADLAELCLLFDQLQHQLQQLLKQARSVRQSVNRLERADTIQPHRLSFWHTKILTLHRGSEYAAYWLDQMKRVVVARQEIGRTLALHTALENLFFHSTGQLLDNIGSVAAQYHLLGSSLEHQATQLRWWQRQESTQQSSLARTFLLTLTVLFIGYIAFGSDTLRWENGGGLVLTLLVVGSLVLSVCIGFLINHQEYQSRDRS